MVSGFVIDCHLECNRPLMMYQLHDGSVVASWLLDLTAISLLDQKSFDRFSGRVSASGEGRWTINAAIDEGTPVPVLSGYLSPANSPPNLTVESTL